MARSNDQLNQLAANHLARIDRLYGDVSALKGDALEQFAAVHLDEALLDFNINLEEAVVLSCQRHKDGPTASAINEALRSGRITPAARRDLLRTDIIAKAPDIKTRETFHFVVEVSQTVHDNDLERAERRARICSAALQLPIQPVVLGGRIHPDHQAYAAGSPVPTLLHPRLDP